MRHGCQTSSNKYLNARKRTAEKEELELEREKEELELELELELEREREELELELELERERERKELERERERKELERERKELELELEREREEQFMVDSQLTLVDGMLEPEICKACIHYFEKSPRSTHTSRYKEPEINLPSMAATIRDRTALRITGHALASVLHRRIKASPSVIRTLPEGCRITLLCVRKYSPEGRPSIGWHTDSDSDLSVVIFLGNEPEGGGDFEYMESSPGSLDKKRVIERRDQVEGSALVFRGCNILHRTTPVTSGSRYSIVAHCKRTNVRRCKLAPAAN